MEAIERFQLEFVLPFSNRSICTAVFELTGPNHLNPCLYIENCPEFHSEAMEEGGEHVKDSLVLGRSG